LIEGLRDEVAWLGNTSWPGIGSNTVLAGHVTVRGLGNGPFRYLENLAVGDQVTLYTEEYAYTYTMREQIMVDETNLGVLLATTNPQLTLVTCTGWDTELEIYRYRMVVFADLAHTEPLVRQGTVR
jgi:LPXTG-site transpeptidase (sortase) family protein